MTESSEDLTPYQQALMQWYERMSEASEAMTPEQRRELQEWERANLDGHSVATSDWPGWVALVGRRPWPFDF